MILLNGASGSGKSTLAKALQARIGECRSERYKIVSIDDFLNMKAGEAIYEDDVFEISGRLCERVSEVPKSAPGVMVDHVITSERIFNQFKSACGSFRLRLVYVGCPLETLRKRETERGNRPIGSAEASLAYRYPREDYDLTVDTHFMTPEACSERICEALFAGRLRSENALQEKSAEPEKG